MNKFYEETSVESPTAALLRRFSRFLVFLVPFFFHLSCIVAEFGGGGGLVQSLNETTPFIIGTR